MATILKIVKWTLLSLATLVLGLILLAIFINWNWVGDYAARKISEQTGRKFTIGNLEVDFWSLRPHLRTTRIRFENASWGKPAQMVKLDALKASIDLVQLIEGRVVIPELIIEKPVVHLEKSRQGKVNWQLNNNAAPEKPSTQKAEPVASTERGELPAIGKLVIRDGQITYDDPAAKQAMRLAIANISGSTFGPGGNVTLDGHGRLQGQPWRLDFNAGAFKRLVATHAPYPIHLRFDIAKTRARVNGKLTKPVKLAGGKVNFSLRGPGLKMLSSFLGPNAPRLPAYEVVGRITRAAQTWHLRNFQAEVGRSDLQGDIGINTRGKLPFIKADLVSHRLDYADFQALMGAKYGKKNASSAEQQSEKGAARMPGKSPKPSFNLGPLRRFNAQVSFKGKEVIAPNLPLEDVALGVTLRDGRLAIKPFNLGVAGGYIKSQVRLDSSGQPARAALQTEVSQVNLKEILRGSRFTPKSVGNIAGRAHLNATGDSIATLMTTLDGQLSLAMEGGKIDSLLLKLVNLHVLQAISDLVGDEKGVPIECAITDLKARNGQVDIESVLVVTKDTYFTADGSIDLDSEGVNVVIYPHPTHFSLFAARTPLRISGPFSDLKFYPDYPAIAMRISASVALGIVATPLAALIPLVERGTGNNHTCSRLITIIKEQQSANKSPASGQEVQSPASFIERRHDL